MSTTTIESETERGTTGRPWLRRTRNGVLALVLLAAGGAAGAAGVSALRPHASITLLTPVAISDLADGKDAAVKGQVAEVFGNKFVLADTGGRALVETGRAGEGGGLVKAGEPLTVQGRFDDGFLKAVLITRADGTTVTLAPPPPRHGPGRDRGPGPAG